MFAYERTSTVSSQHQRGGMTRSCKKKNNEIPKESKFHYFFPTIYWPLWVFPIS